MIIKPQCTVEELRDENPEAHSALMEVVFKFAQKIYQDKPELQYRGLEKIMDDVVDLVDEGFYRLFEVNGYMYLVPYNEKTQGYAVPEEVWD